MQSRKHENFTRQPPGSKLRPPYRFESDVNPGLYSTSSSSRRSNNNMRPDVEGARSLSPQGMSQDVVMSQRIASNERSREYGWHLSGGRTDRVRRRSRSRSPLMPFVEMSKRAHFEEEAGELNLNYSPPSSPLPVPAAVTVELQHRHGPGKYGRVTDDLKTRQVFESEQNDSAVISKEELNESTLSVGGKHGLPLSQKLSRMEDDAPRRSKFVFIEHDAVPGAYQSPTDLGPDITGGASGGHIPSSSRSMSRHHSEQERLHYPDPISLDELPMMQTYKGHKPMFLSRDGFYPKVSGSHSKDFFASSSTGMANEFQDYHRPSMNDFSRSSRKHTDSSSVKAYREAPVVDFSQDPDSRQTNQTFYQRDSPRFEHDDDDYFYSKSSGMTFDDDHEFPPDDMHLVMHPARALLDYDRPRMGHGHGNLSKPSTVQRFVDGDSSGNSRKIIMLNNPTSQRQKLSEHPDISRISDASKRGGEYMGSGHTPVKYGRRVLQDYETSHLCASQNCHASHLKEEYGYERDASLKYRDRLPSSSKYDSEMHRRIIRMQSLREDLPVYESSHRVLKRKYVDEEFRSTHNPRTIMSGKWNESREFQDLCDSGEEWNDEVYTSESSRFSRNEVHDDRRYARLDHHDEFESDDWLPSQDSLAHAQKHSVSYYKHSDRYSNHQKYGSLSRHKSHQGDMKSDFNKQQRVWKRNDNYLEDVDRVDYNDADPSKIVVSSQAPEPPEDSEEFIQLIQEAFLTYAKQLNIHQGVRRRYMEQGKAGTLFCVVCGRSSSKEFMDTQRLVTHAFMSRKAGLRAQHLGLLKAVCALLGWNTVIPTDIVLWVPDVLPKAKALAQKEDLILWPPVIIIHNISMSDNNPENWKVVSIEALEAFLRGKGLIRGRIKMCLGKPADQSVLLVKFLGTFTGLGNAERIHEYFAEQNRGREDFERATSNKGKIVEAVQGNNVEERLLHGYMGIVEDLDKVDFNTRTWSVIKSKKEIQDLANAPVKP